MNKKSGLKKGVLVVGFGVIGLCLLISYLIQGGFCPHPYTSWACVNLFKSLFIWASVTSFAILFFSVLTFWMKEVVSKKWINFATWYLSIATLIYFIFLWLNSGTLWRNPLGDGVGFFFFFLVILGYFVASTNIIIKAWFLEYKNKNIGNWKPLSIIFGVLVLVYIMLVGTGVDM